MVTLKRYLETEFKPNLSVNDAYKQLQQLSKETQAQVRVLMQ
jgi:hypothetical protein